MKLAIICANGQMEKPSEFEVLIQTSDLIIAADGGSNNCEALGVKPQLIIGDLDSLNDDKIRLFRAGGTQIMNYPTKKNETDLELALLYAMEHGFREVVIIGGLGARWDMTIGNILLMAHEKFQSMNIRMLDGAQEFLILRPGAWVKLHGKPGDTLSLIPISGDATGIRTQGLEYPLNNEKLIFATSRGISNVLTTQNAQLSFNEGLLLCIINRKISNSAEK